MHNVSAPLTLPIKPELVVREPLGPGAVALIREKRANPSVTILGYIRAGAMHDPAGREGLALFTAAMLTRGTASYTSQGLAEVLDSLGASLNVRADLTGEVKVKFRSEAFPLERFAVRRRSS